jgi:hypothetical protein
VLLLLLLLSDELSTGGQVNGSKPTISRDKAHAKSKKESKPVIAVHFHRSLEQSADNTREHLDSCDVYKWTR